MLDFTSLHESSITYRKDAIRAMDDLCRRIMSGGSMYGQQGYDMYGRRELADSPSPRPHYAIPQMDRTPSNGSNTWHPDNIRGYSPNVITPSQSPNQYPAFQRAQSNRQPDNMMMYRHAPSHSWGGTPVQQQSPHYMTPQRHVSENEVPKLQEYNELDQLSELSLRDSGIGSDLTSKHTRGALSVDSIAVSDISSKHTRGALSVDSIAVSDIARQTSGSDRSTNSHHPAHLSRESSSSIRNQSFTSETRRKPVPSSDNNDNNEMSPNPSINEGETQQSQSSRTASATHSPNASATSATIEAADDTLRAMHAPEVVTDENRSMLSQQHARSPPRGQRPSHFAVIHPAFRSYNYVDGPTSPEADNVWSPLPRPAKHNNYHGFCKGAWQIRKSVSIRHQV